MVHALGDRKLFYPSAHVGIIFDPDRQTQKHLLAHRHEIRCATVS